MSHIFHKNNLEETMKKWRSQLILSLLRKIWSYYDENAIDFRWSDVKKEDEKDVTLTNFIESLQKQTDEENVL